MPRWLPRIWTTVWIGCGILSALLAAGVSGAGQAAQSTLIVRIGDGFPLLLMAKVQHELKLSADQTDSIQRRWQAVLKLAEPTVSDTPPTAEQQQAVQARQLEMEDKTATNLLDAGQQQRLRQILLQARGPGLLLHKEVGAELGLTPAQVDSIRSLLKRATTQRTKMLSKPQPDDAARRKHRTDLRALRQSTAAKVEALLTPEQQKKWKAMLGDPFDIEAGN